MSRQGFDALFVGLEVEADEALRERVKLYIKKAIDDLSRAKEILESTTYRRRDSLQDVTDCINHLNADLVFVFLPAATRCATICHLFHQATIDYGVAVLERRGIFLRKNQATKAEFEEFKAVINTTMSDLLNWLNGALPED
ncbi:MAG: hypothetical protein PVI21_06300 [Candidatus Woesebacteria bacterium]|jgi:hypothetical protein